MRKISSKIENDIKQIKYMSPQLKPHLFFDFLNTKLKGIIFIEIMTIFPILFIPEKKKNLT